MIKLIDKTFQIINKLFSEADRQEAIKLLEYECADNLPLLSQKTILDGNERIRFAVIKLADGDLDKLHYEVGVAKQDWRDVLIFSDFGDMYTHEVWAKDILETDNLHQTLVKWRLYNIDELQIRYLCDNLHFADIVSSWIYNEFIKGVRDDLTLDDITARISKCNKDTLPIRFVAVLDGKCVGTVSLVKNDLKCRNYTPWLAALYVDQDYRGHGIAKKLISFAQNTAKRLKYKKLYLRTEHASGYYKKLGWQFVEKCSDDFGLEPEVFKYILL